MPKDIPNQTTHFQGKYLTTYSYDQTMLDGSVERWEVAEWRPVAKLFVFPSPTSILLADEYRYDDGAHVLRIPGGYVEDGETPEQAAIRESQEELGVRPAKVLIYEHYKNWGPIGDPMTYACICSDLTDSKLAPDPGESISVEERSLEEIERMILDGAFANSWEGLIFLRIKRDLESGKISL